MQSGPSRSDDNLHEAPVSDSNVSGRYLIAVYSEDIFDFDVAMLVKTSKEVASHFHCEASTLYLAASRVRHIGARLQELGTTLPNNQPSIHHAFANLLFEEIVLHLHRSVNEMSSLAPGVQIPLLDAVLLGADSIRNSNPKSSDQVSRVSASLFEILNSVSNALPNALVFERDLKTTTSKYRSSDALVSLKDLLFAYETMVDSVFLKASLGLFEHTTN